MKTTKKILALILGILILTSSFAISASAAVSNTRYSVLVLDVSGSMSGSPVAELKVAATKFCEEVLKSNRSSNKIVNNPGTKTINYREGIALTASVQNPVDGIEIQWYVNGEPYSTGENFIYNAVKSDLNVEVKIVNSNLQPVLKDGNEISASETVKVKAGFLQRLIAFFKFTIFHIKVIQEN